MESRDSTPSEALDALLIQTFELSDGRLWMAKELATEIGLDRIGELTTPQLEAEIEVVAKRMHPGAITGLATGGDQPGMVRRILIRAGRGKELAYELTEYGESLLRRIAQLYRPAGE